MKKIRLTMTMLVSDEYYEKEALKMKNEILSGKMQREVIESSTNRHFTNGVTKCTATFEDLTDK